MQSLSAIATKSALFLVISLLGIAAFGIDQARADTKYGTYILGKTYVNNPAYGQCANGATIYYGVWGATQTMWGAAEHISVNLHPEKSPNCPPTSNWNWVQNVNGHQVTTYISVSKYLYPYHSRGWTEHYSYDRNETLWTSDGY
jgi:hypothetical protein